MDKRQANIARWLGMTVMVWYCLLMPFVYGWYNELYHNVRDLCFDATIVAAGILLFVYQKRLAYIILIVVGFLNMIDNLILVVGTMPTYILTIAGVIVLAVTIIRHKPIILKYKKWKYIQ
jgi:hypothetical protein